MDDKETAQGYRQRAEELRRLATNFRHEGSRIDLIEVAEKWERMAERLKTAQKGDVSGRAGL
jgi:hypothetical protein